jgi:ketosteroid isomerase-like protein
MKFSSLACALLLGTALAGSAPAQPAPQKSDCPANAAAAENYMQMHQIEADFHRAATDHDIDRMMSLFANGATVDAFGKTYTGADQIRRFWLSSGPFTHHWVGYTPAFRIAYTLDGDTGHLHFECFYVNQDNQVALHADINAALVLQNGKWLMHDVTVTPHPVA